MSDSEIERLITEIVEKRLKGGVAYGITNSIQTKHINNIAIIDIPKLKAILKEIIKQKLKTNGNNLDEIRTDRYFGIAVGNIMTQLNYNRTLDNITLYDNAITVPFILTAKIENSKVIEKEFGEIDSRKYTPEEIKVILKEAEEKIYNTKFKNGRYDRFTFLSIIADINGKFIGINSKNPIRFITPDNDDKDKVYKEIEDIINQAKQDLNSPNILLIPYSADGHIVTLLIDKKEFPNRNSVACFDSSHYFNGYIGWIKERLGRESKPFKEKHFSFELYGKLKDNKNQ